MKKKERQKLKKEVKILLDQYFSDFENRFTEIQRFQEQIEKAIPKALIPSNKLIECVYSTSRNQYFIYIQVTEQSSKFEFNIVEDNPIDYLDKTGSWKKNQGAFFGSNGGFNGILSHNVISGGMKPFDLNGSGIMTIIDNIIQLPNGSYYNIEFGLIISHDKLYEFCTSAKQHIDDYWYYFKEKNKPLRDNKDYLILIEEYRSLANELKDLVSSPNTKEELIDKFLEEHLIILEKVFDIKTESFISKPKLKNIVKVKFNKDLTPDVICKNSENIDLIIDYKRAKRTLIKNFSQPRESIMAEVTDLKSQLNDYRDYFDEDKHRQYFKKNFGRPIRPKPYTIGIIGYVDNDHLETFIRQQSEEPQYRRIIPYNLLLDRFERLINNNEQAT